MPQIDDLSGVHSLDVTSTHIFLISNLKIGIPSQCVSHVQYVQVYIQAEAVICLPRLCRIGQGKIKLSKELKHSYALSKLETATL